MIDLEANRAKIGHDENPEDGTFAEYIIAKGDICILLPDSISFAEAATLGVGMVTIALGLYKVLGMPFPTEPKSRLQPPSYLLIYGGSTASGTMAIQFAKLSGQTVITTCSPRNFDLVKNLGADLVLDYVSSVF